MSLSSSASLDSHSRIGADTGKPVKHLTDGLGETTTSATRGVHKTTEAATNGVTDTLTDTVTGVSNADILGITSGATGGLGRTVSGTGEALVSSSTKSDASPFVLIH